LKPIYTIGFTQKTAEQFFETLGKSGAKYLLDIRLNNTSQLAGYTKKRDLKYLLKKLLDMEYQEVPEFAPTKDLLKGYRRTQDWESYEKAYATLLAERSPEKAIQHDWLNQGVVLLCSEAKPEYCHRRVAAEYLSNQFGNKVSHL
jgi:uncharacterized protein (DUF488 family)